MRQGISDGQKRRLMVARQLIALPKILFLDEPTSGLDSAASYEVIYYLKKLAQQNNMIIICSIHQPATSTFNIFNKLLLLSAGKPHFFGAVANVIQYYSDIGIEIPHRVNPADFILELVNIDFSRDKAAAIQKLDELQCLWQKSTSAKNLHAIIERHDLEDENLNIQMGLRPSKLDKIVTLLHRSFIKSYRDPMACAIRLGFAIGFAILTGTVWLRLDHHQDSIQTLTTELYFIPCFMSLSAIISAPAFLEDHAQYIVDFRNDLYGVTEFLLSNFIVGILYNIFLSFVFSITCYWLSNLASSATAFFTWVMWIFLTTLAAEALVVFVISIFPNFIFTIGMASFLNSLLLCAQGFFIPISKLNAFYKYGLHYWDFLAYSFEGLMVNQFSNAIYSCDENCRCLYDSPLAKDCQIAGSGILHEYGFNQARQLRSKVGVIMAIILGYRLASWMILKLKSKVLH